MTSFRTGGIDRGTPTSVGAWVRTPPEKATKTSKNGGKCLRAEKAKVAGTSEAQVAKDKFAARVGESIHHRHPPHQYLYRLE